MKKLALLIIAAMVSISPLAQARDGGQGFGSQERGQRMKERDGQSQRAERGRDRGQRRDHRLTDEERRDLHRDLDRAHRELYRRRPSR